MRLPGSILSNTQRLSSYFAAMFFSRRNSIRGDSSGKLGGQKKMPAWLFISSSEHIGG
jgi:hypothetical protein